MLRFEDAQVIVNAAIAEHQGDRWTDSGEALKKLAKKLADAAQEQLARERHRSRDPFDG
jgi:hypothetical protein